MVADATDRKTKRIKDIESRRASLPVKQGHRSKRTFQCLTPAQVEAIRKAYVYDGVSSAKIAEDMKVTKDRIFRLVCEKGFKAERQAVVTRRQAGLAEAEAEAIKQTNDLHRDLGSMLSFKALEEGLKAFEANKSAGAHAAIASAAEKYVKIFRQAAGLQNGDVNITQVNHTSMFLGGNTNVPRGTISSSTVAPSAIEAELVPEKPNDLGASPIG